MATGSGKTIVMAMTIAWQILNKGANPRDARFSRQVRVVAPGLTVKSRYLEEWTAAVTAHGGFGRWRAAVVRKIPLYAVSQLPMLLDRLPA
jgi:hypothetical protein